MDESKAVYEIGKVYQINMNKEVKAICDHVSITPCEKVINGKFVNEGDSFYHFYHFTFLLKNGKLGKRGFYYQGRVFDLNGNGYHANK